MKFWIVITLVFPCLFINIFTSVVWKSRLLLNQLSWNLVQTFMLHHLMSVCSTAWPQPLHSCRAASGKLPPQRRRNGEKGLHHFDQHQRHHLRQEQPKPRTFPHERDTVSGTKHTPVIYNVVIHNRSWVEWYVLGNDTSVSQDWSTPWAHISH